jgi:hypothetical protein
MLSTCDCGSSDDTHTNVHWLIAVRPHYNLQMPLLAIVVLVMVGTVGLSLGFTLPCRACATWHIFYFCDAV